MPRAARWPSATAVMMIRGPNATSPPAKISGRDVASVSGSASNVPRGVTFRLSPGRIQDRSVACPMASTTVSQSTVKRWSSRNVGWNRPRSSNTRSHLINSTALTLSFSPMMRAGPQRVCSRIPSRSASSISSRAAGISSRFSRQYISTAGAPLRIASRATSNATRRSDGVSCSSCSSTVVVVVAEPP